MRSQREKGVALITALLVLFMISAIVVGLSWMVMTDVRLGGNNQTREMAFYGAEAGMEKLTADVGNTFITKGTVGSSDITTILNSSPSMSGVQFKDSAGNSTYQIMCGASACSSTNPPTWTNSNVLPPSPYAGMGALINTLGLQVAAQTTLSGGGEVKLQRQVQLLAIPVFQFGVFSQTDLAFFNSPTTNFLGRVHTNGNLWLAPESGPLNLWDTVTASGQVIRTNLENGWPGASTTAPGATTSGVTIGTDGSTYGGYVNVALTQSPSSGPPADPYTGNAHWRYLDVTEGSTSGYSVYGNISPTLNNPNWSGTVEPAYNGMLIDGAPSLNLSTTALGGISNPIFLIRRPVVGERSSNLAEFNQQYFSQVSLRILLDDYATPGNPSSGCSGSDVMSLDGIDTTQNPIDLATLDGAAPSWWAANATQATFLPLPTAALVNSAATTYTVYNISTSGTGDGYWVTNGSPTITGCIKIEYQDTSNAFHDITKKILGYGFSGRNINPSSSYTFTTPLKTPYLPTATQVGAQGPYNGNTHVTSHINCTTDPSSGAIIRLARLRDNPATAASANNYCGTATDTNSYDYWPMALFDTREGVYRPFSAGTLAATPAKEANPQISARGVMYYVEVDAANLASWFSANQSSLSLLNTTGFGVYFSDRRGEQLDPNASNTRTGSFGFNDVTNPSDATNGCPNFTLDAGEDLEGDGVLRTYGATPTTIPYLLTGVFPSTGTNLPSPGTATYAVMQNPNCSSNSHYQTVWPGATYVHTQEARENPAIFFRRALKIVDGATLNAGTSCYGTGSNPPCGLTIASENPVYVQGDFNAAYSVTTSPWTTPAGVATSIAADAVTFLSDNWNDVNSFINPYNSSKRAGVTTAYRVAIISGKQIPFPWPSGESDDFGTDGGVQNFPRLIENWSGTNLYYQGSFVSFYFDRQANGLYGYDTNLVLYNPPSRSWSFDSNFTIGTQWLPPDTPSLRTINTTGFSQMLMPNQ